MTSNLLERKLIKSIYRLVFLGLPGEAQTDFSPPLDRSARDEIAVDAGPEGTVQAGSGRIFCTLPGDGCAEVTFLSIINAANASLLALNTGADTARILTTEGGHFTDG
ncbi:MAG: hypothetical protein ABI882_07085 [Acidobacteriota bacterium]